MTDSVSLSVILATYNQPEQLEKVLCGYAVQTRTDFELVIADDGSSCETADVLVRTAGQAGLHTLHVWHEDRGFRKTEILNRAILAASGDYLIFSDGDCIPRNDFVATHAELAERGRFLSGGYLKLDASTSAAITPAEVRSGLACDPGWLRSAGWKPGRHALRLTRSPPVAAALDALTPTRPTWNGHNASGWRSDVLAANGYALDMAYGGLDRALGEVLENAGVHGKQIRHRAPCLHLHHDRPYADPERWRRNAQHRKRIRSGGVTRTERGITELEPDPTLRISGVDALKHGVRA